MGNVALGRSLFDGPRRRPPRRSRHLAFLAGSAAVQAAFVSGLLVLAHAAARAVPRPPEGPVIAVRLVRPPAIRAPSPPPAVGTVAPRSSAAAHATPTSRMVQPREVRPEIPESSPVEAPPTFAGADSAGDAGNGAAGATGAGGRIDGTVGGSPSGEHGTDLRQAPTPPMAARPTDLASVRAGIARTLVYPPNARRNGLQGKVLLEFVLLADGRIRDLLLRIGSGHAALDAAALAAVEAAAPFSPPGVDVLVTVPVVFRSE